MGTGYTGADYAEAASKKTDWATADHMRRAMFGALEAWNALPEKERTAEKGRELWVDAPLHDEILIKAGTEKSSASILNILQINPGCLMQICLRALIA